PDAGQVGLDARLRARSAHARPQVLVLRRREARDVARKQARPAGLALRTRQELRAAALLEASGALGSCRVDGHLRASVRWTELVLLIVERGSPVLDADDLPAARGPQERQGE